MNRSSTLRRKLIYLVVLVAMLIPLYLLGQPAGGAGDLGGELSKLRHKYNIAESDLGEISPASETMKLASLGLRGVAATLLWNKAHEYQVSHEWDRFKATLNNIALLQPHFDKVWEHQAHNLAYNVSTEFDDYRQRYETVREGTEFLTRGVRQNRNAPRLIWYTGWFYGAKMGMSDEKQQFRRLFADDEVLHQELLKENIAVDSPEARGPLGKPDNWLVGRLWLNYGYGLVDSGVKIRRQTPLNFYETGPKWRIKHAEAIEKEGILDESAQTAWQLAAEDWQSLGNRSIPTTSPFTIKLDHLDELRRQRSEKQEEFASLTGEAYERARQTLVDTLSESDRKAWEKPKSELTDYEKAMRPAIESRLVPDATAVVRQADPSVRLRAVELIDEMKDLDERIQKTDGYRNQINYPYWKTLAQAEQEERTVRARRLIYEAEKANEEAMLDKAIELYEEAFAVWAEIFDDYPLLTVDDTAEDLFNSIRRYMVAIDSEEMPDDFPLKTFVEMMGEYGQVDPQAYMEIEAEAELSIERRRKELEEEERRREEAANQEAANQEAMNEEAMNEEQAADSQTSADTAPMSEEESVVDTTETSDTSEREDESTESQPSADQVPEDDAPSSGDSEAPGNEESPSEPDSEVDPS